MEQKIKIRRVDFYPDDWIAGTLGLCHEERSVYISICVAIWSRGEAPITEKYVRQICPGPHFARALAKLVAKGKVARVDTEAGPKLAQKRAASELKVALKRTETSLENGAKGGRPKGLENPRSISPRGRATPSPLKNKNPSSSVESVAARTSLPNGGAGRAHDDETVNWKPLGNAVPPADASPPPPMDAKIKRAGEHYFFLLNHGRPGEAVRYLEMLDAGSQLPPDETFNAIEARMTTA